MIVLFNSDEYTECVANSVNQVTPLNQSVGMAVAVCGSGSDDKSSDLDTEEIAKNYIITIHSVE